MTVKLSSLRADTRRENEGAWVDIPELPGVSLRVRGFSYGPFQAAKSIVLARWARKYGRDPAPPDVEFRENGRLYHDHLLLEWKGFDEPYDPDLASQVLVDPAYRELHEHIRYATNKISQIDTEFVEGAAGNSGRSSDGSSQVAA
jgi:hypothetical protein